MNGDSVTDEVLAMLDAETQEEEIIDDESIHLWWFFFLNSVFKKLFTFGCAGASLVHGLFSSCSK